jgi:hypothetical protein
MKVSTEPVFLVATNAYWLLAPPTKKRFGVCRENEYFWSTPHDLGQLTHLVSSSGNNCLTCLTVRIPTSLGFTL